MALPEGTSAPSFSLPPAGDPEERITLEDAKGFNFCLLFFPMAFTGLCTEEMCRASDDLSTYRNLEAEILGISVNSPFTLEAWADREDIRVPLLSDFNREAVEAFDVKRDELRGLRNVANRAAFLIDKQGIIRYSWESEDPSNLPPFDELEETLEGL